MVNTSEIRKYINSIKLLNENQVPEVITAKQI